MARKTVGQIELDRPAGRRLPVAGRVPADGIDIQPQKLDKITHDVRGSINIIVGYAQMMLDETTGKINAQQRRALKDVLNCANKLYSLTDDILKRLENTSGKK